MVWQDRKEFRQADNIARFPISRLHGLQLAVNVVGNDSEKEFRKPHQSKNKNKKVRKKIVLVARNAWNSKHLNWMERDSCLMLKWEMFSFFFEFLSSSILSSNSSFTQSISK
jgi:hypothetical protein